MNPLLEKLRQLGLAQISDHSFPPSKGSGETAHALSDHTPIWAYCPQHFSRPYDKAYRSTPLYALLPKNSRVQEVTNQTRFVCLFGATSSPIMDDLTQTDAIKMVFEPDVDVLLDFIASQDIGTLLKNQFFFFAGDYLPYGWSLEEIISPSLTKLGFPVAYIQPGREEYGDYFEEMIRRIEFAYYREQIYPALGQENNHGKPFRPLKKGIFYDQEHHRLQNIIHTIESGNPKYLENTNPGPMLLLGAGPGLKRRPDLLRHNALSVTVNSAYAYCLSQEMYPDITLINDTSLDAAQSLLGHAGTNPNILFAHWASGMGDAHFTKRYVGWEAPSVFGERPTLPGYGSVASAAFSLAQFMGAEECVMSGFHLATHDPHGFSYASGETGKYYSHKVERDEADGYRYPDLYPVKGADGETLYTTLNFMDAAMVMLERMQQSGMRIINTDTDSLLHGEGIISDPGYTPPACERARPEALTTVMRDPIDLNEVARETELWRAFYDDVLDTSKRFLAETRPGPRTLEIAEETIRFYDENSFSYLMQRYRPFHNSLFHKLFFSQTDASLRLKGALYYFEHAHQLARECTLTLEKQQNRLQQLIRKHGPIY